MIQFYFRCNVFAIVSIVFINIHLSSVTTVYPDSPRTLRVLVQNQHGYRKYRQIFSVLEVDQYGLRKRQFVSAEPFGSEDIDCRDNPSQCFIKKIQIREGRVIDDDYDAVDALEFAYEQGLDYMGMDDNGDAKDGWGWDKDEPYSHPYHYHSLHRPTGNIYYPGNKYYSGSHANVKLFKKKAKKGSKGKKKKPKYKKSKYHLGPIVHFNPYEDYDDGFEYNGWSRTLPITSYQRYYN